MKKMIFIAVLMVATLVLAACGSSAQANTTGQTTSTTASANPANGLPLNLELAVGTFKLEGTPNQVDAKTAADLLPLWKAVKSLSSSSTTAAEELNAVYTQIQDTLTPARMAAIKALNLTRNDLMALAQEKGIAIGGPGNMTPAQQATAQANQASGQNQPPSGAVPGMDAGGPPAGGPPAGGGGPGGDGGGSGGGGSSSSSSRSSSSASQSTAKAGAGGMDTAFYDALIQLLEERAK
jgi:ABC-type glycerol-3-phosphate transport system substrate-binding protein